MTSYTNDPYGNLWLTAAVLKTVNRHSGILDTHRPLYPDGGGGENGGVVQVDDHFPQFPLDLTMVHTLTSRGDICMQIHIEINDIA